jgi:P-type Cu+ transporter
MRAERVGRDTLLAQIVQMVAEAQRSRAPIQRAGRPVSAWFVPASSRRDRRLRRLGGLGPEPRAGPRAGQRGRGADHRLPLRARPRHADVDHGRHRPRRAGGRARQERRGARAMEKVDTLVVDKTGHADRGQAALVGVHRGGRGRRGRGAAARAAALERGSEHPLAAAIVAGARRGLALPAARDFDSVTGKGVTGTVDGRASRSATRADASSDRPVAAARASGPSAPRRRARR